MLAPSACGVDVACETLQRLAPFRGWPWRQASDMWLRMVAELLLIQTDAPKVNDLWDKIISALRSPQSVAEMHESEIAQIIRPLGLFRQRAKRLKELAVELCEKYNCEVPCSYENLASLPGVGRYVASVMCLHCGCAAPPPVDINVARVIARVMLGREPAARYYADADVLREASKFTWSASLLYGFIDFAAEYCRKRPQCAQCPLREVCKFVKVRKEGHLQKSSRRSMK